MTVPRARLLMRRLVTGGRARAFQCELPGNKVVRHPDTRLHEEAGISGGPSQCAEASAPGQLGLRDRLMSRDCSRCPRATPSARDVERRPAEEIERNADELTMAKRYSGIAGGRYRLVADAIMRRVARRRRRRSSTPAIPLGCARSGGRLPRQIADSDRARGCPRKRLRIGTSRSCTIGGKEDRSRPSLPWACVRRMRTRMFRIVIAKRASAGPSGARRFLVTRQRRLPGDQRSG